jgi:DNA-binding transcriptional MerR regulator
MSTQTSSLQQQAEENTQPQDQIIESGEQSKKAPSAFRTISEVADELGVQQHVLRFWETKFSQVRPLKRGGGRRYYRPEDVALLQKIHHLLYTEGYTIKGVQKLLREVGKNQLVQQPVKTPAPRQAQPQQQPLAKRPQSNPLSETQRNVLEAMLSELKELRELVKRI